MYHIIAVLAKNYLKSKVSETITSDTNCMTESSLVSNESKFCVDSKYGINHQILNCMLLTKMYSFWRFQQKRVNRWMF